METYPIKHWMPVLQGCPVFKDMTEEDLQNCLSCSGARVKVYPKGSLVFDEQDCPENILILLDGHVSVIKQFSDSRRAVIGEFTDSGELLGEVLAFLGKPHYEYIAEAEKDTQMLLLPKAFAFTRCGNACSWHSRFMQNMLEIFAQKAYFLNQRLQIMSCSTLRQKLARILLLHHEAHPDSPFSMTQTAISDFLNVARPSVSRELRYMKEEGLVELKNREILVPDYEQLMDLL